MAQADNAPGEGVGVGVAVGVGPAGGVGGRPVAETVGVPDPLAQDQVGSTNPRRISIGDRMMNVATRLSDRFMSNFGGPPSQAPALPEEVTKICELGLAKKLTKKDSKLTKKEAVSVLSLGLQGIEPENATNKDWKKAYQHLQRKVHPDKNSACFVGPSEADNKAKCDEATRVATYARDKLAPAK